MQLTHTTLPVPYFRGPPEVAFGMGEVITRGNTAEATMRPGPWALDGHGPHLHQGCLGVLIDDVTAYAGLTARDEDRWAVSSAISVDFHSPITHDTTNLSCSAAVVHSSRGWGHVTGQVTSGDGEMVATVGQRLRYIPGSSEPHERPGEPADASPRLPVLDSLLTLTDQQADRTDVLLNTMAEMRNPLGMLHGGVGLCISELAARRAWAASPDHPGEAFHTASLQVTYLRPGRLDEDMTASVRIRHASRSVVLAEVSIRNADGKDAVFALSTLHRSATVQG